MSAGLVDLQEVKRHLPLPELMNRLGFGDRAKSSARCPFHNDQNPSFGIYQKNGRWAWKCHAGCGGGDEIDFLAKHEGLSMPAAIQRFKKMAGVDVIESAHHNETSSDIGAVWERSVAALVADDLARFADWRGYSPSFCEWLRQRKMIGLHKGLIALPIHNDRGHVAGIHVRHKDGFWRVEGRCKMNALVIGNPEDVGLLFFFESQWDAFAFLNRMDAHESRMSYAVIASRGASNGRMAAKWTDSSQRVFAFGQNDDAGKKWLADVAEASKCEVASVSIPVQFKDLNEWTKSGAGKEEIDQALQNAITIQPEVSLVSLPAHGLSVTVNDWPTSLAPEASHGLAGEIIRTIEPHSEADPVGLLSQFLAAFGNVVGRKPYFQVEGDRHRLNLFVALVGQTAKGRKGTSWGWIKKMFEGVNPEWVAERIKSGLSSGEGLIWAVRDRIEKEEQIKEKGRITGETQMALIDSGVDDKRLLVMEPELASILRVLGRDGNTLSALIRQAWDLGDLRTLTKNSPAQATGAHITIVSHVTKDELLRYLDRTEIGNGFANRFLCVCVRRSKLLPEGGSLTAGALQHLIDRISDAVGYAKDVEEMKRDEEARDLWRESYATLSDDSKPGLFGVVTSRAEAQVVRLSCLYALLDKSNVIGKVHLQAALALWKYVEDSSRCIFGDACGDPTADAILQALRNVPDGLTRTEINHRVFSRNVAGSEIQRALGFLLQKGMAEYVEERDSKGRPTERWKAKRNDLRH